MIYSDYISPYLFEVVTIFYKSKRCNSCISWIKSNYRIFEKYFIISQDTEIC